ncbi:FG-GAP repeat domain-containing protein [Actinoplanes awajinensis]|uniref:FG-GAP repeat domain-containing protein n=1 Tax=Actinoplanes awajinensis TaxID=135946 RepID=UPI001E4128A0|nr:VCBS repeat-containing protein [Actinoplanes awajinensis]
MLFRFGSSATRRWLLALTLAGGTVMLPSPAMAKVPDVPSPSTSCAGGSGTSTDRQIAGQLRSSMTGQRIGSSLTAARIACARGIVRAVQQRGLGQRAAVLALTTAITESSLNNHLFAVDHDSLGLFQQRPSMGWGSPDELVDVTYATNAFLNAMIRKYPGGSWQSGEIGPICQRVQTSAHPAAYAREAPDAQLIVSALWADASTVTESGTTTAARPPVVPAASPVPTGPFQKALAAAATSLGPLDGHHALAMADWNGDKHPDLLSVSGAGVATGKTEVRIINGATNFGSLLLTTATVLGPTDERSAYAVADWNADGRPDLVVVQKSGTASGKTEVRIVDGASNFQQLLVDTATVLGPTDDRYQFSVADGNADGRLDLVAAQTTGTASKKVEVQVVDGASSFQKLVGPAVISAEPARDGLEVSAADWNADKRPDLVTVQKSGTASGKTEVRVLDGASGLTRSLAKVSTAQPATDDRHEVLLTDWNADGHPDLAVVQKTGTASGWAEVTILGG